MFYFAVCMNILFSLLLAQLVKYDVHTTCKIKFIHALIIIDNILLLYCIFISQSTLQACRTIEWICSGLC